ncbi:MAG: cell division protein ZapA [Eubacteriales bacterium]
MSTKNNMEITIGGKSFTLSAHESKEYLQHVASYIDQKLKEFGKMDSYLQQTEELKNILLQLNIADDYFKARKKIEQMGFELTAKDKDVYDIKHELVSLQMKLEKAQSDTAKYKQEAKGLKSELKMLNNLLENMTEPSKEENIEAGEVSVQEDAKEPAGNSKSKK